MIDRPRPAVAVADDEPGWPPPLSRLALGGLAGDIVAAIEPHTESDPVAILAQLLVGFGSMIGRGAHYAVEATRHHPNEFVVLVGASAKARKGSSWDHVERLLAGVEAGWAGSRVVSGLSSGEGLIWAVRDHDEDRAPTDKRLLVLEAEFAAVLKMTAREGCTLSPIVRNAWDGKAMQSLTKNSPARATGAHVSIVGHITAEEFVRHLSGIEAANGFLNRFIILAVRRSKLLPEGGNIDDAELSPLLDRLAAAVCSGRQAGRVSFDESARSLWWDLYPVLSEAEPGLRGAVCARAEAHVVRLALLYALLDGAAAIGACHLRAALALWEYAAASARWVFGDALGDPTADDIHKALLCQPDGLTRSAIRDLFHRNRSSKDIGAALEHLRATGKISVEHRHERGRPAEVWRARPA